MKNNKDGVPPNEMSFTFDNSHKDLGTFKEGQTIDFRFTKIDKTREIVSLTPSCGCFNPIYIKNDDTINVSYKTKGIPEHLKKQGYFFDTKKITVNFNTGLSEILSFSVKVVK